MKWLVVAALLAACGARAKPQPPSVDGRAEIQQAYADYQRTRFGGWPWPSEDPVHSREEGRFARHADGRTERPA